MRIVKKDYLPTTKENTFIRLEVYYHLGGFNCFTHEDTERGFYLSAVPVVKARNTETFVAFSGGKLLLNTCARYSKKAAETALQLAEEKKKFAVNIICERNKLTLQ